MQLLLILFALLFGGKGGGSNILEGLFGSGAFNGAGNDNCAGAFNGTGNEDIMSIIFSLVQSLSENGKGGYPPYPLAPVAAVADEEIASALSRYVSLGE